MITAINSSSDSFLDDLGKLRTCQAVFLVLFTFVIIALPLFVYTVLVGFQRWRKQHSNPTAETITHSDIITFNMVALEFVAVLGMCLYFYGLFSRVLTVLMLGYYILSLIAPGQTLFHVLTCVERYLAVVHPVTYVQLKQSAGVRIRNISISCVWGICFAVVCLAYEIRSFFIANFVILLASAAVVLFCSLSVLCVLIHPASREVRGNRVRVDLRRLRAFHTIAVITGVLFVRLLGISVYVLLNIVSAISRSEDCLMSWTAAWLSLPSSLVLPLLFLHRAGKLRGCQKHTATG